MDRRPDAGSSVIVDITIDYLRLRLRYDPSSGKLFWRHAAPEHFKLRRTYLAWNTRFAGTEAGAKLSNGYLYINIKKRVMLVHRVCFAMTHGYWPEQIDHINHDRSDNRLANLRSANVVSNGQNITQPIHNTSGRIGVYWYPQRGVWYAKIGVNGKKVHLGYFDSKADAITAREAAELKYQFHPNHGLPANDNRLKLRAV